MVQLFNRVTCISGLAVVADNTPPHLSDSHCNGPEYSQEEETRWAIPMIELYLQLPTSRLRLIRSLRPMSKIQK